MEIIESKVRLGELVGLEDLLYESDDLWIIDVNPLVIKNYSGYLDYYSPTPKVIITIARRGKLIDIRVTLDTRAEVSCISLNVVLRFKILITYSTRIAL
jgi:predicted metalloprotease with PDZ domain